MKLLMATSVIETLFYLPNRFRLSLMLNTQNIAFTNSENALLSLMPYMFNQQNVAGDIEFKVRYFLSSYNLFFASTLPYEALSFSLRLKMFEKLNG